MTILSQDFLLFDVVSSFTLCRERDFSVSHSSFLVNVSLLLSLFSVDGTKTKIPGADCPECWGYLRRSFSKISLPPTVVSMQAALNENQQMYGKPCTPSRQEPSGIYLMVVHGVGGGERGGLFCHPQQSRHVPFMDRYGQ